MSSALLIAYVLVEVPLRLLLFCSYGNFLTEDECDHLIKISKPHMKDATILDKKTGKQMPNRYSQLCSIHS